jgi:hypothetical protein
MTTEDNAFIIKILHQPYRNALVTLTGNGEEIQLWQSLKEYIDKIYFDENYENV